MEKKITNTLFAIVCIVAIIICAIATARAPNKQPTESKIGPVTIYNEGNSNVYVEISGPENYSFKAEMRPPIDGWIAKKNLILAEGNYSVMVKKSHHFPAYLNLTINRTCHIQIGFGGVYSGSKATPFKIWPSTTGTITDKWEAIKDASTVYRLQVDNLTMPVNETTYQSLRIGDPLTYQHWGNTSETFYRDQAITAKWTRWISGTEYYRMEMNNQTVLEVPEFIYYRGEIGDIYDYASFEIIYQYDNDSETRRGEI